MDNNDIIRRNNLLYNFFNKIFPKKIAVIGNPNYPAVVYDNAICLSCYVHNFDLRFVDKPEKGKVLFTVKLKDEFMYDYNQILDWFKNIPHHTMSKICLCNSAPKLYLSGYNFVDRELKEEKYPVFSHHHPKLYHTSAKAIEIINTLKLEGYSVEVC